MNLRPIFQMVRFAEGSLLPLLGCIATMSACASLGGPMSTTDLVGAYREIDISNQCTSPAHVADSVLRALDFVVVTDVDTLVETDWRKGPNRSHLGGGFFDRLGDIGHAGQDRNGSLQVHLLFHAPKKPRSPSHTMSVKYRFATKIAGREQTIDPGAVWRLKKPDDWEAYRSDIGTILNTIVQNCGGVQ